jgi:hypothetical protein
VWLSAHTTTHKGGEPGDIYFDLTLRTVETNLYPYGGIKTNPLSQPVQNGLLNNRPVLGNDDTDSDPNDNITYIPDNSDVTFTSNSIIVNHKRKNHTRPPKVKHAKPKTLTHHHRRKR